MSVVESPKFLNMVQFESLEQITKLRISQSDVTEEPLPPHMGLIPSESLALIEIETAVVKLKDVEQLLSELCELKSKKVQMRIRSAKLIEAPICAMGNM